MRMDRRILAMSLAVTVLMCSSVSTAAPADQPNLMGLTMFYPGGFGGDQKEPAIGPVVAQAKRDESFPSPDLLKPILLDLSENSIPGRVTRIVRVIIGLIGLGVLIYGMVRMLLLAWDALTGTRSVRSLLGQLSVYVLTFVGVLALLHGFMLETILGVYQFFSGL